MTFNTIDLTNDRVVVKGQDIHGTIGETVLDGSQWAEVKAAVAHRDAHEVFDAAVDQFFAPIIEAQDKLENSGMREVDPITVLELEPAVEGVVPQRGVNVQLTKDSQILRILESGETSRLVWVADTLEIAATVQAGGQPTPDEVTTEALNA